MARGYLQGQEKERARDTDVTACFVGHLSVFECLERQGGADPPLASEAVVALGAQGVAPRSPSE